MKKIFLLLALVVFVGTTTVTPVLAANYTIEHCGKCDGDKKCEGKCSKKEKKACAKAGKSCCASKATGTAATTEKKSCAATCGGHKKAEGAEKTDNVKADEVK